MALLHPPGIARRHSLYSDSDSGLETRASSGPKISDSIDAQEFCDEDSTVTINVGGKVFKTFRKTLAKLNSPKLDELVSRPEHTTLFFDRNPDVFASILDFCRTDELHLPKNVCILVCKKEFSFWGVSESNMSDCCKKYFNDFLNEIRLHEALQKEFTEMRPKKKLISHNRREMIYHILHYPESSIAAKVWAAVYYLLVLVSVSSIFLSTVPECRIPLNGESLPPYYSPGHDHQNHSISKRSIEGTSTLPNAASNSTRRFTIPLFAALYDSDYVLKQMETNSKVRMMVTSEVVPAIEYLDLFCMIYFTIEFIARLITVPNRLRMFLHFFTWCDLMYLIPVWTLWIGQAVDRNFWRQPENISAFVFLEFLIVARVVALFRVANQYRALRVLVLSLRASLCEILVLLVFVAFAMIVYSSLIYCVEIFIVDSMDNMFEGLWWSLITMTTVGYGDMVPKSSLGYFVACVCALTGIIVIGMPVPIITSNFHKYYGFRDNKDNDGNISATCVTNSVRSVSSSSRTPTCS